MKTANNPSVAGPFVVLGGNSTDHHAHGGRDLPAPPVMNKRIQVARTDHPRTDRWVSLTTVHEGVDFTYRVAVVNGFNTPTQPPKDYTTLRRARTAANRLLTRMETS